MKPGVLGILMWLPAAAGPRLAAVEGYEFSDARHIVIMEAIRGARSNGEGGDLPSVIECLTERRSLDRAGGLNYLKELVDAACMNGAYRFAEYVRMLRAASANGEGGAGKNCATAEHPEGWTTNGDRLKPALQREEPDRVKAGLQTEVLNDSNEEDARGVEFPVVQPWESPVDGAAVLRDLRALILRYVVLPSGAAEILALWTLHTYAYELRRVTTYIAVLSPGKRCGKTTVLTILRELAHRALLTSNISPPAIFRAIEAVGPTLLIDEIETFLQKNAPIRGILNAGYTRESAFVVRVASRTRSAERGMRNSQQEATERARNSASGLAKFSCWCPKAMAGIGELPETLSDRCIVIRMRRKKGTEKCERFRGLTDNELARKCVRFVADHAAEIKLAQPAIPEELNDRAADIWEPLLVLADLAGGEWPEVARKAAVRRDGCEPDLDMTTVLLNDLEMVFRVSGLERIYSRQAVEMLRAMEGRPWAQARRGGPINELWLAMKLRAFGIYPRLMRGEGGIARGYYRDDFAEVFDRYMA